MLSMMGYGNSYEGYYRKREREAYGQVSNSSETITEKETGAIET